MMSQRRTQPHHRHTRLAVIGDPAPDHRRHDAREHQDRDEVADVHRREPDRLEIQSPVRHQHAERSEIEKIKSGKTPVGHKLCAQSAAGRSATRQKTSADDSDQASTPAGELLTVLLAAGEGFTRSAT